MKLAVGWKEVAALAVVLSFALAPMGWAFDAGIHKEIVREALPFVKAEYLDVIAEASDDPDKGLWEAPWHFDNCYFIQGLNEINKKYDEIKPLVAPQVVLANARKVAELFGHLLHPAQDLYAHSNWVETMAAMGYRHALFDRGIARKWKLEGKWSWHPPGVIIAQGKVVPDGWEVALDKTTGLVTVIPKGGPAVYAIISGLWKEEIFEDECCAVTRMWHKELHKDKPGRPFYKEARELAIRQTVHEWCRLESLVFLWYGAEGLKKLRETFIASGQKSPCGEFCTLRIRAQDTAMNELKGVRMRVAVGDGWDNIAVTPSWPLVVQLDQQVWVQAPPELKDKGLVFVEWKLAERKPGGKDYFILWWLSRSPRNEWIFKVEKCDLELIAVYGPPPEEKPVETVPPPPGEEPPPGELPPPPGE